jgi:cytochrome c556
MRAVTISISSGWLRDARPITPHWRRYFSSNKEPLKDLFKQVCRKAMTMGMVRLGEVGFDATRVKAANSRYATLTTPSIEQKLAAIDAQIDAIAEATATALEDAAGTELPEERRQSGTDPMKKPAQVPTTDPQSKVMPNKEGGFAPNYTPTALTDGESGIILDANVLAVVNESGETLPAVDRVTELCGEAPENFRSDGGNASGAILEEREINAVVPVKSTEPAADSPALQDDLTQPVPEDQWEQLARNSLGQLDKSNFIYDADRDVYHCPGGRELPYESRENRNGVERMRYRSLNCDGCPLVALCLQKQKDGEPPTGVCGTFAATLTPKSVSERPSGWRLLNRRLNTRVDRRDTVRVVEGSSGSASVP